MNCSTNQSIFFVFFFLMLSHISWAQHSSHSKIYVQKEYKHKTVQEPILEDEFFKKEHLKMGLSDSDEMRLERTLKGKNGFTHSKFQQFYNNIPVFGSAYTLHSKNGQVQRASGYYLPLIQPFDPITISKDQALRMAIRHMDAELYAWEDNAMKNFPSRNSKPTPELVIIDAAFPASSGNYKLAYQIDMFSTQPFDKQRYFIDTRTGQVILSLPLLMHNSVEGTGVCKYYGEQEIIIDSLAPDLFELRDLTRGNGNAVFSNFGEVFTNDDKHWDLTNENQDEVAIDAHYCTQRFYDLLSNDFNWNGLGNNGESMNIIVHQGDFVNAFWDGQFASFGDGDCNNGPLTTLEVVAHEFMHGVTDYTSNLVYQGESGAINESMSDVFGKALEYYEDPENFNWYIGQSFKLTPYSKPFRSFEDPNIFNHPKMYGGEFWSDFSGVHTNSSIGNHWFYLLVEGGTGTNENEYAYDIQGIGMDKALQIVFLTQTTALTPNSSYQFYYETSLEAAKEIYGENAIEVTSVEAAWKAVGIPSGDVNPEETYDLTISVPEVFVYVCLQDEYYPIEVTITNLGEVPYIPSNDNPAIIEIREFDLSYSIEDTIVSGESKTYIFDNSYFVEKTERNFIRIELLTNDNNNSNHVEYFFVQNNYHISNDFNIDVAQESAKDCSDELYHLSVYIENESCNTLPEGLSFQLSVYDETGTVYLSENYQLLYDLASNDGYDIDEWIDFPFNELEIGQQLFVKLDYNNEVDEENNIKAFEFDWSEPIDEPSFYDFTVYDDLHFNSDNFFYDYRTIEYLNQSYLFNTGFNPSAQNNSIQFCDSPEGILESTFFKNTMDFCVTLGESVAPKLSFDLMQFRTDEALEFPELAPLTSIFKLHYTFNGETFEDYIYNQDEGVLYSYEYDLPVGFNDKVIMEFFNYTGSPYDEDFYNYDVILLDNLSISAEPVSTNQLSQANTTNIFPNPSDGSYQIKTTHIVEKVSIITIQNRILLQKEINSNAFQLELDEIPDGYYFVLMEFSDGSISTERVVKMSE